MEMFRPRKPASSPALLAEVCDPVGQAVEPGADFGDTARDFLDDPEMWVSHEASTKRCMCRAAMSCAGN